MSKDDDGNEVEPFATPQRGASRNENLSDDVKHKIVYFLLQHYNPDTKKISHGSMKQESSNFGAHRFTVFRLWKWAKEVIFEENDNDTLVSAIKSNSGHKRKK